MVSADFSVPTEEHVIVSETQPHTSEGHLKSDKKPSVFSLDLTIPTEQYIEVQYENIEDELNLEKLPKPETATVIVPTEAHFEISEIESQLKTSDMQVERIPRSVTAQVTLPVQESVIVSELESNVQVKEFSVKLPALDKAKQTLAVEEPITIDEIPGEVSIEQQVTLPKKKVKSVKKEKGKIDFIQNNLEETADFELIKPTEETASIIQESLFVAEPHEMIYQDKPQEYQKQLTEEFSPFTVTLPEDETITEEIPGESLTKTRTVKVSHKISKDGKTVEVKEIVETFAFSSPEKSQPIIEEITEMDTDFIDEEPGQQPIVEEFEEHMPQTYGLMEEDELHGVLQEDKVADALVTLKKTNLQEFRPDMKNESSDEDFIQSISISKKKKSVDKSEVNVENLEEQIIQIPRVEEVDDNVEILIESVEEVLPKLSAKLIRDGPDVFISEIHETKVESPVPTPTGGTEVSSVVSIKKKPKIKEKETPELSEQIIQIPRSEKLEDNVEIIIDAAEEVRSKLSSKITDSPDMYIFEKQGDLTVEMSSTLPEKKTDELLIPDNINEKTKSIFEAKPVLPDEKMEEGKPDVSKPIVEDKPYLPFTGTDEVKPALNEQIIRIPRAEKIGDDIEILIDSADKVLPELPAKVITDSPDMYMFEKQSDLKVEMSSPLPEKKTDHLSSTVTIKKKPKSFDDDMLDKLDSVTEQQETTLKSKFKLDEIHKAEAMMDIKSFDETTEPLMVSEYPMPQKAEITEFLEQKLGLTEIKMAEGQIDDHNVIEPVDNKMENAKIILKKKKIKDIPNEEFDTSITLKRKLSIKEAVEMIFHEEDFAEVFPEQTTNIKQMLLENVESYYDFVEETLLDQRETIAFETLEIQSSHPALTDNGLQSTSIVEELEGVSKEIAKPELPVLAPVQVDDDKPVEVDESVIKITKPKKKTKPEKLQEEEKPEETTEAVLRLKKSPKDEKVEVGEVTFESKPLVEDETIIEVAVERKFSLTDDKGDSIEEKTILIVKDKPEETELSVVNISEKVQEEMVTEQSTLKLKKKPKKEQPSEISIESKEPLKEVPETIDEQFIQLKKEPEDDQKSDDVSVKIEPHTDEVQPIQKTTLKLKKKTKAEEIPELVDETAVIQLKKKPVDELPVKKVSIPEENKDIVEGAVVTIKTKEKPLLQEELSEVIEITDKRKPSLKEEMPEILEAPKTRKPSLKEDKPEALKMIVERKPSLEEYKENEQPFIEAKEKEKADLTLASTLERKPSVMEETPEETEIKTVFATDEKSEDQISETLVEQKPSSREKDEDKIVFKLKKKLKEEDKTTEITVDKELPLEEIKPDEVVNQSIKLKKKPKDEDKIVQMKVKSQPSLEEKQPEEVESKLTVIKIPQVEDNIVEMTVDSKPQIEEQPDVDVSVSRKSPTRDEAEKPIVEEKAILKIKKKPKQEEKPLEATIERTLLVKKEKPEAVEEKAVLKLKRKPKEEEKPAEANIQQTVPAIKPDDDETSVFKIKKKPKEHVVLQEEQAQFTIPKEINDLKQETICNDESIDITLKPTPDIKEEVATITVPAEEVQKPYEVIEEESKITIKKEVEIPEKTDKITLKKKRKPSVKDTPDVQFELSLDEKLADEKPQDVIQKFTISAPKLPEEPAIDDTVHKTLELSTEKEKEYVVQDDQAEITVKKKIVEDIEDVKVSHKLKKKPITESEIPVSFKIPSSKGPEDKKPETVDDTFAVKISKKKLDKTDEKLEIVSDVVKLPDIVKQKEELEEAELTVQKEVAIEEDTVAATVIKRRKPKREKSESPVEETFDIPRSPDKKLSPEVETVEQVKISVKKPKKQIEDQDQIQETVKLELRKDDTEDLKYEVNEAELTVKKEIIIEDDKKVDDMEVSKKLKLKRKSVLKTEEKTAEETFVIPCQKEEKIPIKEEEILEENISITLPEKIKPTKDTTAEDTLKLNVQPEKSIPSKEEEADETTVVLKPKTYTEKDEEKSTVVKLKRKVSITKVRKESLTVPETFEIPKPQVLEEVPIIETFNIKAPVKKPTDEVEDAIVKITDDASEYKVSEEKSEITVKKVIEEKEEKFTLKKKKPEKKEEVSESFKISKKPEELVPKDEKPMEVKIDLPKKKTPVSKEAQEKEEDTLKITLAEKQREKHVSEEQAEITVIKEVEIDEDIIKKDIDEKEEKFTLKKKKPEKKEEVYESFKISKKPEELVPKDEKPMEVKINLSKKKSPVSKEAQEKEEDTLKITLAETQKEIHVSEEQAEITVVKEVEIDEDIVKKDIDEKEEKFILKKKKSEKKHEVSEVFKVSKKPEESVSAEEGPTEVKIDLQKKKSPKVKEVPEEDDSFKLTLKEKPKETQIAEEHAEVTVIKKVEVDTDDIVEEKVSIKKPKKKSEYKDNTVEETLTLTRKESLKEEIVDEVDVEESFAIKTVTKKKPDKVVSEEESASVSLLAQKPEYKVEEVSEETKITLEKEVEKEVESVEETIETVEFVATSAFNSEQPDTLSLVEGERILVIEKTKQDWWFVRKTVTNERGYVNPKVLQDSDTYTHYMKDTLSKKMEKLPVLRLPKPGEKLVAPKFVQKLKPLKVLDGQTAEMSCQVSGNPRPTITWFKQTQIIKPSVEFQIFYDDDNVTTLIIREVFPEDAGTYTVVAKNAAGFTSCSSDLIVEAPLSEHGTSSSRFSLSRQSSLTDIIEGVPPVFSEKPKDKTVDEGKPVELTCKATGIPEPTITWLRNQKPLVESDRIEVTTLYEDLEITKGTVTIKKAKPEDAGTYEIIAENSEGKSVTSLILNVTAKPKKPKDEPPTFTQTFSDITCTEKDSVTLTVKVQGTPQPEVTWYKNGKMIKPSGTVKPTTKENVHTLQIENSKSDDSGDYKCVAKNPKGTIEHTATVTVQKTGINFVDKLYDSEVKERETAVFTIEVSHPDAQVTWHKDGEQLKPSDRIKFVEEKCTRKIIVEDINVNDEGEYTCVLGENERTAELTVIELPPDFKGDMKDVTVASDQNATFDVEMTKGDARARWFKDDKEIDYSEHIMLKIDGKKQKLIIYNATFEDMGTYTCKVGTKHRSAKLKVEAPTVEFTAKLPEKMSVPQDTDASFTVELSRPNVPVTWLKNGQPISEKDKDKFKFVKDRNVHKLVVLKAQKDDAAEYTCVAGNVKTTTKLQVQEAYTEFTLKLRDVTVRESDTATLLVEITRETLEVRWMKDGQTLRTSERIIMEKEGCRRRLIVKDASTEDRGMYTCVLEEKTCSSTLTVEVTPRVVSEKRHFKVKRGGNVTVDVEFTSLPPPKIEWFYKGKPVSPDKKRTFENYGNKTVLTIKKVEDADVGDYTLKLSNKCGENKTDFTVSIIDKPKPPGLPNASEIGSTSLTLSWKAPESDGGSPITNYIIEYHDRNNLRYSTYNENVVNAHPFSKVENLKEGEEYMFRVIAVNEVGKSDPSPGTKYIMVREAKAGEPPAVVEHLQPVTCGLKKNAKMTCRISGQPPPTIKWLKNGKDMLITKNIKTTYENQIATLEILETTEKSAGTFTCKASNHLGTVETTNDIKIQEPPSAKFDENQKNVRLKSFTEYILDVKVFGHPLPEIVWLRNGKVLESSKHTLVQIREDSTIITIRSTENTDSGTYTLQLTNPAGTVKHDFKLFVLDKPLAPEGPVVFHKIDKTAVTIGWNPPSIGESEVLSYIIERCETRRKVWIEVATVNSSVLTQEITELSEGIEYSFRIIATNDYGRSEPLTSDPVIPKSLFDKPHAPKGPFTTSNMTETSFTLAWLAPDNDGGSVIIEYIVERKEASRKAWQRVGTTDGKSLSMEVAGLKPETPYHFRVCCRNEVGHSPYYAPDDSITPGQKISPPSSPEGPLVISNMTNKTLTLSWKPPKDNGGAELTAYIVEKMEVAKKSWTRLETLAPHIRSYTVHNLTHTKEYSFRVFAENPAGLSPPLETDRKVKLTSTAERPSPPTGPLEKVITGPCSVILAWGRPEKDGGSPILGYTVALRNVRRIMWMEVGQVDGETQKLQIKDLQEDAEYLVRIMARNEVGISDPFEPEESVRVTRPPGYKELDPADLDDKTLSVSYSTTSSSWMREANMEPLLRSYTKHILAGRNEYFFRIWHLAETLSK